MHPAQEGWEVVLLRSQRFALGVGFDQWHCILRQHRRPKAIGTRSYMSAVLQTPFAAAGSCRASRRGLVVRSMSTEAAVQVGRPAAKKLLLLLLPAACRLLLC